MHQQNQRTAQSNRLIIGDHTVRGQGNSDVAAAMPSRYNDRERCLDYWSLHHVARCHPCPRPGRHPIPGPGKALPGLLRRQQRIGGKR